MVDLGLQKPITGTFQDLDPMGLLWSMRSESWASEGSAFVKTGLTPTPIHFSADVDGHILASATLERLFVVPGVTHTTIHDNGLASIFFKPSGSSTYPAIIAVGGSEGGIGFGRRIGAVLASHGYSTLGLAYFAYPGLPSDLANISLEYFETAIRWLQSRDDVQAEKIAVVGLSRGGELALVLGSTFPQIKAVVAYVPSNRYGRNVKPPRNQPAWTYRGTPFQPDSPIPVEKINGPILLISAGDDKVWPSGPMTELIIKRLAANNFAYPYQNLYYKGAGHAAGFPFMPTTEEAKPHRHPVNDCFRRDCQRERILEIRFVATGSQISRSLFEKVIVRRLLRDGVPSAARAKQRNEAMVYRENSRRTLSICTTRMEHSPTSATGTGWERTPWHATQRAAWEALDCASRQ